MRRALPALLFTLALPVAAWSLWRWTGFRGAALREVDYALYVAAARQGLDQGWHHLYDLEAQRRVWQQFPGLWWFPNVYTPALAVFMVPFAGLPLETGYALFATLLFASLLLSWWLLAPGDGLARLSQLPLVFALWPVVVGLWLGQVLALQIGALALACVALRRGRERTAGALLAVIALKPQGMLLVPFALLAAGRRKLFAAWSLVMALIGAGVLALIGFDGALAWLHRLSYARAHLQEFKVAWSYSLARRIDGPALWLIEAGAVALTLLAARRHRDAPELVVAAGLAGSLVASPFIHLDDFMLLLPALWLLLRAAPGVPAAAVALAGLCAMELSFDEGVGGRWLLLYVCLLLPALLLGRWTRPGANPSALRGR